MVQGLEGLDFYPLLFQLCPDTGWAQQPSSAQGTLSQLSHLAEDLIGWLGSNDPGSQENHCAKGSPLPMPGLHNNSPLKMLPGIQTQPRLSLTELRDTEATSCMAIHTFVHHSRSAGGFWPDIPTSGPQDR